MILEGIILFCFGLAAGSFLNVCIYRLPRGESIVWPGSHCPQCGEKIKWSQNIPVLSFLMLGGKCKKCQAAISIRYAIVELAAGFLWAGLYLAYGWSWTLFSALLFFSLLLALSVIDLETGLLPDALTFPGMAAGLILSIIEPSLLGAAGRTQAFIEAVTGLLSGGAVLWVTGWLGSVLFKKESMGGGDVKLMAMMGAFLGWKSILLVFFIAPLLALPVALYAKFVAKKETIPFGPYLALGGAVLFLFGAQMKEYFLVY